ncbi:hypothetical protein L917_19060 [Phytophthora nicotianae]|uniref:Uncharacterized protein n=1 Tax=Phytophthora nicotianae TaxID=4792 RepID=W2K7Q7_PHYNI|nr:hypothetical protein L917_19060 [Phytophthora nicotianae]
MSNMFGLSPIAGATLSESPTPNFGNSDIVVGGGMKAQPRPRNTISTRQNADESRLFEGYRITEYPTVESLFENLSSYGFLVGHEPVQATERDVRAFARIKCIIAIADYYSPGMSLQTRKHEYVNLA